MVQVLRRDTGPELAVRRKLHSMRLRYRVDVRPEPSLARTADIVFRAQRVAVFIDGCFWHRCPKHCVMPISNAAWWQAKLERNSQRDAQTTRILAGFGWCVLRFWEHESAGAVAARIARAVRQAARGVSRSSRGGGFR